jgi:twinkle protein
MMLTAKEISERLSAQAEDFCRRFYPNGKKESGNWCVGSIGGEAGDSLRIQVVGSKAGIWMDFATGTEKGDLLDLIAAARNVTLGQAIRIAKEEYLGIRDPGNQYVPKKKYFTPKFDKAIKLKENPGTPVEQYLTTERKLTIETIHRFRIAQHEHPTHGPCIAFPSKSADGKAWIAVKWIALKRTPEGKKIISMPTKTEGGEALSQAPTLFGWQAFPAGSRVCLIVEGQIDAMTWSQWGMENVLSIPNGVGDPTWIDYEWDALLQFDTIFLSFDMDDAGKKAVAEVARRLGIHRCPIVKLPHNDANACLLAGCGPEDAARWMMAAKPITPQEIKAPIDFKEKILARNRPPEEGQNPIGLEIPELRGRVRFLPAEVTMWTGYSTHGKTSFLLQLALYAAQAGENIAIGSFEMRGEDTCEKMSKCLAFSAELGEDVLDSALRWMSGKIWIYDFRGLITQDKLYELMSYSVMRHGVKHVIIDSLMKCQISSEDYEAQRLFLNKFISFCADNEIHGHIVAHPKKSDDDSQAPDIMDIHGGQSVSGQPDRIITLWRNIKKEDSLATNKMRAEDADKHPDAFLCIQKDRVYGKRQRVPLWYLKACERFTAMSDEGRPYYQDFGVIKK